MSTGVPGAHSGLRPPHPFVRTTAETPAAAAVRTACHQRGFDPRIAHTVEEQATALALAAGGLGVTLASDLALSLLPPGVDIIALDEPVLRTVSLAHRSRNSPRPSIGLFVEAVRSAANAKGLAATSAPPRTDGG